MRLIWLAVVLTLSLTLVPLVAGVGNSGLIARVRNPVSRSRGLTRMIRRGRGEELPRRRRVPRRLAGGERGSQGQTHHRTAAVATAITTSAPSRRARRTFPS